MLQSSGCFGDLLKNEENYCKYPWWKILNSRSIILLQSRIYCAPLNISRRQRLLGSVVTFFMGVSYFTSFSVIPYGEATCSISRIRRMLSIFSGKKFLSFIKSSGLINYIWLLVVLSFSSILNYLKLRHKTPPLFAKRNACCK